MKTTIRAQTALALSLLKWHGGQSSPLYAIGSCMLSDCYKKRVYNPRNHWGHAEDGALLSAISELKRLEAGCVSPQENKQAASLTNLAVKLVQISNWFKAEDTTPSQ